jgi:hypothetical protein
MSEGMGSAGGERFEDGLLDAAEALVDDRGFEGLESGEAAAIAGRHDGAGIPSEWELFVGVVERDEARFYELLESAIARGANPGERLMAVIEACVNDYDWGEWIELWSLALRDERARELRERLDAAFRSRIKELIDEGKAAGDFQVTDSAQAALTIATAIDALAVEATLGDDTVSPNFMFGAIAMIAGRLVGTELRIRERGFDG